MMETKELHLRSNDEIRTLRRENEILRAKVEMIDLFACVLHTQAASRNGGMMSPDIAWELQKEIERLEKDEKAT